MLQPVFDNDYMPKIANDGWPPRWSSQPAADATAQGAWQSNDLTTFSTDGKASGETWLRYQHRVPTFRQWAAQEDHRPVDPATIKPQLITDFTAYDTGRIRRDADVMPRPPTVCSDFIGLVIWP